MTPEDKMVKKIRNFRTNPREDEYIGKLAEKLETNESNVLRRALRNLAKELEIDLPPDVFADKPGGNWVKGPRPKKEDHQARASQLVA